MACVHCRQPLAPCPVQSSHWQSTCTGWIHARTGTHHCSADRVGPVAQTPDGQPPSVTLPAGPPEGEVA